MFLVIFGTLLTFSFVVSRALTWFRLRDFSGPVLASFSYLWIAGAMRTGKLYQILIDLHDKYGSIVRIGPNELLLSDIDSLLPMSSVRSGYSRGAWYSSVRFDPYDHSLFSEPDTAKHDARKSKLTSGYSGKGKMNMEQDVDSQLEILVDVLRRKYMGRKPMDFGRIARYFTVDVTTLVGMGKPWGDLATETDVFQFIETSDAFVPFMHTISMISPLGRFFSSSPMLKLIGPKPTDPSGLGKFLGVAHEEVQKRINTGPIGDVMHRNMLDEWLKQGLTPRECEIEIALLVPAGSETTTSAIRGVMLHILASPCTYNRLKVEIREGIRENRISKPIKSDEAKRLPYLQAVILEGMRMVPPVITGFSKRVPPGGDTIGGTFAPGGTDILINMCAMLRDKRVFGSDADLFRPERFLECSEEERAQLARHVDLVFGHGRWMCPGKTLAWIQLNKIFVELLRSFDFQIANPEKPWRRTGYATLLIDDFWIQVMEGGLD
ncbi:cytochrome P450 [Thozetella sp. PMI_491]|nr:cytochrome P450 [Thozetella sp. PMI_491]